MPCQWFWIKHLDVPLETVLFKALQVFSSEIKCSKQYSSANVSGCKSFQAFRFVFQALAAWCPFQRCSMGSPPSADGRIGFGLWTKPACNLQNGSNIWATLSMSIWSSRSRLAISEPRGNPMEGGEEIPHEGFPFPAPPRVSCPILQQIPALRFPKVEKKNYPSGMLSGLMDVYKWLEQKMLCQWKVLFLMIIQMLIKMHFCSILSLRLCGRRPKDLVFVGKRENTSAFLWVWERQV